jgi:hypothetical protein
MQRHLDMRAGMGPHINIVHDIAGGRFALVAALFEFDGVLFLTRQQPVGQVNNAKVSQAETPDF